MCIRDRDKGYHNPVTTADHAADSYLKKVLKDSRPEYGWLSEETVDSPERLTKDRVWVVDPLDGTKEFIEGVPNFVVSVGLVVINRWCLVVTSLLRVRQTDDEQTTNSSMAPSYEKRLAAAVLHSPLPTAFNIEKLGANIKLGGWQEWR